MKKSIITFITVASLAVSSVSFASVSNDETAYLFGTQEAIEMQVISADEMATTEGQLFGITVEQTFLLLNKAAGLLKPFALPLFNKIKVPVANFFLKRVNAYFQTLPGGSELPPLVATNEPAPATTTETTGG